MVQRVDKLALSESPTFLMLPLPRQSRICIATYDRKHLEAPWTLRIRNTQTDEVTLDQYVLQGQLEARMRDLGSMHHWIPLAVIGGQVVEV